MAVASTIAVIVAANAAAEVSRMHREQTIANCKVSYTPATCDDYCIDTSYQRIARIDKFNVENLVSKTNTCISAPVATSTEQSFSPSASVMGWVFGFIVGVAIVVLFINKVTE